MRGFVSMVCVVNACNKLDVQQSQASSKETFQTINWFLVDRSKPEVGKSNDGMVLKVLPNRQTRGN